jgi:hypothetical protein
MKPAFIPVVPQANNVAVALPSAYTQQQFDAFDKE